MKINLGIKARVKREDYLLPGHQILNVAEVVAWHVGLGLVFWFGERWLPFPGYVAIAFLASGIHQKFISEWVHEASHFNFVANKRYNDILINFLGAYLFGVHIKAWRAAHLVHHDQKYFFTPEDPDSGLYAVFSKREFVTCLLKDLTGITAIWNYLSSLFRSKGKWRPKHKMSGSASLHWRGFAVLFLYVGSLLGLFLLFGRLDVFIIYFAALLTPFTFINRVRIYGQHIFSDEEGRCRLEKSDTSRTIDAGIVDRILFTSKLMMFHNEHHDQPGLPFRALADISEAHDNPNVHTRYRWSLMSSLYRELP